MGDHRASIKISFTIHGKEYKEDCWINYCGHDGVDGRIIKFFEDAWDDAYSRYLEEYNEAQEKIRSKEIRESELKELERLQEKYKECRPACGVCEICTR